MDHHHHHYLYPQGGPDTDELYNSLKRLSNSTAMSTVRLRKFAPKRIPFKPDVGPRTLTFSLSEVSFTNGKPNVDNNDKCEIDEIVGVKRDLYQKPIRVIGTSIENCVLSDTISIDIDPESTRLPMMCKLMIIVEGACLERGERVLVRDAAVQIGDDSLNFENTATTTTTTTTTTSQFNNNDNNKSAHTNENSLNPTVAASSRATNQHDAGDDRSSQSTRQINLQQNGGTTTEAGGVVDHKLKINVVSKNADLHPKSENNGDNGNSGQIPVAINVSTSSRRAKEFENAGDDTSARRQHRGSTGGIPDDMLTRSFNYSTENLNNSNHSGHQNNGGSTYSLRQQHHHHFHHSGAQPGQRIFLGRFGRTGSLCNLPHETTATTTTTTKAANSYFSTRHADRAADNTLAESYIGLNDYLSTPYYQYQCKNRAKKDFSNSTYEDMIELGISIPIRMEPSMLSQQHTRVARHRNEKHILVTNEGRPNYEESSTIRTFANNMRRFLTERLSRFEAEVTFFRLNNQDLTPQFRITSPLHSASMECEWCRGAAPVPNYSYTYHRRHHSHNSNEFLHHHFHRRHFHRHHHHHHRHSEVYGASPFDERDFLADSSSSSSKCFNTYTLKSSPSVTNLMYVKIIDGALHI